jgi:hypothetical protein
LVGSHAVLRVELVTVHLMGLAFARYQLYLTGPTSG